MTKHIDEQELRRLRCDEGLSHKAIADIMNVSRGTIRNKCLALGLDVAGESPTSQNTKPPIDKDVLYQMRYVDGLSFGEIAKELGESTSRVRNYCLQYGISTPEKTARERQQQLEEEGITATIQHMYEQDGKQQREIADLLNLPLNKVKTIIRSNGFKAKKTSKYDYISEDEIRQFYIEENHSKEEAVAHFGINISAFDRLLDKYDLRKPKELERENARKTFQDRYGYNSALEVPEFLEKARQTNLARRNVEWPMQDSSVREKSVETTRATYNVDHPMQAESVKTARRKTNQERYGVPEVAMSPAIQQKMHQTLRENYDVDNPMQSPVIQQRSSDTLRRNYFDELSLNGALANEVLLNPSQIPSIREKARKTLNKHYHVDYPLQSEVILERMRETLRTNYGIDNIAHRNIEHLDEWTDEKLFAARLELIATEKKRLLHVQEISQYFNTSLTKTYDRIHACGCDELISWQTSYPEDTWRDWLTSHGIEFEPRPVRILENAEGTKQEIDIYIPSRKIGIEINPTSTHNSTVPYLGSSPKKHKYHQEKALMSESQGIRLFQVFDWQDQEKLKEMILIACGKGIRLGARLTTLAVPTENEERAFLAQTHLQGAIKSDYAYVLTASRQTLISIGLDDSRINDMVQHGKTSDEYIVALMSFGVPRFNNDAQYEYELLRFAVASGLTVQGGASKLFKHFVDEHSPKSILSYSSLDISGGDLYPKLGFEFERITAPSYYWVNLENPSEFYSWHVVLAKGFDNLFGTDYGKGTSNIELMEDAGFVRVYNCGNKVFGWYADRQG